MNEQLQQALAEIIKRATTGIDSATAFLATEMPDVVYQLLLWYGVKSALLCVSGITILVLFVWFLNKYCGKGKVKSYYSNGSIKELEQTFTHNEYGSLHGGIFVVVFLGSVVVSITGLFIFSNMDWLQILIAPKIWLIEYTTMLVK